MQSKRASKGPKKIHPAPPTIDQRSFELATTTPSKLSALAVENIISAVNRALHKGGAQGVRIERLHCSDTGRILSITTPSSSLQDLLKHRDLVLRAAWTVLGSASDLVPQQRWRWTKIHNVSLIRYMGRTASGLRLLREELEAENDGVHIPADIRWLMSRRRSVSMRVPGTR